jgi:hypothetical protein
MSAIVELEVTRKAAARAIKAGRKVLEAGGWEACREAMTAMLLQNRDRSKDITMAPQFLEPPLMDPMIAALEEGGFTVHRSNRSAHAQKADCDFCSSGDWIFGVSPEAVLFIALLDAERLLETAGPT